MNIFGLGCGGRRQRRVGEKIGLDVGKSANKREEDGARWMEESDPSWVGFGGWLWLAG